MMVRETEESIKRTMKLQTVLEHEEHPRRLPYQLLKKELNKVIHEVHFTNGVANLEKDIKYCQYFNKPTAVPSIGVDKNNLNCGEDVHFDIDSESTKLPFFCKLMIVNQGRVHERSEPTLNRDVCLQIGESLIEKLFHHKPNLHNNSMNASLHNISMNTSRYLDLDQHAIDDPNVSFTTPRSTRQRRPSWCCMEEYYSIPFYQYKGKPIECFSKSVNTNVSMGFSLPEIQDKHFDNLFDELNNNNPNNTRLLNNFTNQSVDTNDLVEQIKYNEFSKAELLSPYSLNNVFGSDANITSPNSTIKHTENNANTPLPTLTTSVPRKRLRRIQLTFTDQYTNTTSIPVNPPSFTIPTLILSPRVDSHSKTNPTITVHLPASSPRDISIRFDENSNNDNDEEVYYVKDGTTDTDDLVYYSKANTNPVDLSNEPKKSDDPIIFSKSKINPIGSKEDVPKASDYFKKFKNSTTQESNVTNSDEYDPFRRIRKKLADENNTDPNGLSSNAFGRILRQKYFKKTTGRDPMRFDEYIPYSLRSDCVNLPNLDLSEPITPQPELTDSDSVRKNVNLQSTPNRTRRNNTEEVHNSSTRVSFSDTSRSASRKRNKNNLNYYNDEEKEANSPHESSDFEIDNNDNENELEKLLNEYDRSRRDNTRFSGLRSHRSKNSSIADALSISTIDAGENNNNFMTDPNSCFNNSLEFEPPMVNDYSKSPTKRAVSAYPDYSRYPLISKALNRSLTNLTPRTQSNDNFVVKSSSFIDIPNRSQTPKYENLRVPTYRIRPNPVDIEQPSKPVAVPIIKNDSHINNIVHNTEYSEFCPQCFRESLRQEHKNLYEKENNINNYHRRENVNQKDLGNRIANIIELENDNARYLLKTFINPVLRSRALTSRSLDNHTFRNNIINNNTTNTTNHLVSSMRAPKQHKPEKFKHVKILPSDPKYFRIRHDKTLRLYKEPMPVDILKQNYEDLANVTAATGKSLSESGVLLKNMSKLLASSEI